VEGIDFANVHLFYVQLTYVAVYSVMLTVGTDIQFLRPCSGHRNTREDCETEKTGGKSYQRGREMKGKADQ
jgi:hypothetical protein